LQQLFAFILRVCKLYFMTQQEEHNGRQINHLYTMVLDMQARHAALWEVVQKFANKPPRTAKTMKLAYATFALKHRKRIRPGPDDTWLRTVHREIASLKGRA
jgi:DNA-binding protein Fis